MVHLPTCVGSLGSHPPPLWYERKKKVQKNLYGLTYLICISMYIEIYLQVIFLFFYTRRFYFFPDSFRRKWFTTIIWICFLHKPHSRFYLFFTKKIIKIVFLLLNNNFEKIILPWEITFFFPPQMSLHILNSISALV